MFQSYFTSNWFIFLVCFALLLCSKQGSTADQHAYVISAPPQWVSVRTVQLTSDIPVDELSNGIFYRLLDNQVRITETGKESLYSRYVESLTNQVAVEESAQINVSFEPSYQHVELHTLNVIRDGQVVNKLGSAKISVFDKEQELNRQTYNGLKSLNILIDDVRVGDTIDFSYTRHGANPIYKSIFAYQRQLNWSVPVQDQYVRVLWGKQTPLNIHFSNNHPPIEQKQIGHYQEYQVHKHKEPTLSQNSETPNWYDAYDFIEFSEFKHWKEVVNWALPLYHFSDTHSDVVHIAKQIQSQYETTDKQIAATLRYVQENIRYVGLQMGINSHLPTPAEQTLSLRYGDCKDKTVLLISILKALGIEAYPALVNTKVTKQLKNNLPAVNLFNHVLVTLEHKGKRYWLDPTYGRQEGELTYLHQASHGYALILKDGESQLKAMANSNSEASLTVKEDFYLPALVAEPAHLTINTTYLSTRAHNINFRLAEYGAKQLSQDYEIYYQKIYPTLKSTHGLTHSQDKVTGATQLTEQYQIERFWHESNEKGYEHDFYPSDIINAVYKPKQQVRVDPLSFQHPNHIQVQTRLHFSEPDWAFKNNQLTQTNAFFEFTKHVEFDNNILSIKYDFRSKTDHIPPDQIQDYLKAREKLIEHAYYGIIKYKDTPTATSENAQNAQSEVDSPWYFDGWIITILFYCAFLLFIIISWRIESRRRPAFENMQFFPSR